MVMTSKRRPGSNLAVRAKRPANEASNAVAKAEMEPTERRMEPMETFSARMPWDELRIHTARLYGQGFKRSQIARALVLHLTPPGRPMEARLKYAGQKLRKWEHSQEFRDLVYRYAVVDLDMASPGILRGLAARAQRGRVDAARLALEITGRHTKEESSGPVQVTVNLANVARPE